LFLSIGVKVDFTIVVHIEGDQKVCAPDDYNIEKLQVMFKVSPASLQTFSDKLNCVFEDRVQYSTSPTSLQTFIDTVQIPNVICDGYLQIIICVAICACFFFTVIIRCSETFYHCIFLHFR
jgi:hypothetical protein